MSLEQAQEQLQNALVTTFLANLAFLSEYDNELYHRVDELSRMIEKGQYEEKYALEFIQEQGDFDIYDIVNDKYLYDKKPKRYNNDLVQEVEFDVKNSIFLLEGIYENKVEIKIPDEKKYDIQTINEANSFTQNDILKFSQALKQSLHDDKKKLKEIKKFIFFGTLLGRHIPKIAQKINADIYLVCERNLEIFRLSLFTVDYSILAKNKGVVFSIMDEVLDERNKIEIFLSADIFDNYVLKFSSTKTNIKEYVDEVLKLAIRQRPFSYDYNRLIYTFLNRTTKRLTTYKTLLLNKTKENLGFFANKKVLFLAGGPSLGENLEWIKQNQDKFFIVCIGAVYKKLFSSGIKVDMLFTLDENSELNELQFDDESVGLLKDTMVMASSITDEQVLKKFNQEKLFLYEVFRPFYAKNIAIDGFSVGEVSVGTLLNMGVKELYLIGLDMALDNKTGLTHSEGSSSGVSKYNLSLVQDYETSRKNFGARTGLIEVKGNFEELVSTTGTFSNSIEYMNKILVNKSEGVKVYNLSVSGAYFENTIPKKAQDIKTNEFLELSYDKKEFLENLKEYSAIGLSKDEIVNIKEQREVLENFMKSDFEIYKKEVYATYEEFYINTNSLITMIKETQQKNILPEVITRYGQIILSFLSFQFNNKKQKSEASKVKKVKEIFSIQFESLINDYLLFIKRLEK